MDHPFINHSFTPLRLSAARRALEGMTVALDLSGYLATGELQAIIRLTGKAEETTIRLLSDASGILASCPICRTQEDLPCTHAIAVLLVLRKTMQETRLPPPLPESTRDRKTASPSRENDRLRELSCDTLLLAGTRRAPYFVVLRRQMVPMDHADFHRLETLKRSGHCLPSTCADLFSRAFEPYSAMTSEGRLVPAFRPKAGQTDTLFRFLSQSAVRILSARTKQSYRISCPEVLPPISLSGRWENQPGDDLIISGSIALHGSDRPLQEMLWMTFDPVSILCGHGTLLFLSRDLSIHPLLPLLPRLMEKIEEGKALTRREWPHLLEPLLESPFREGLFSFSPLDLAPRFGSRSLWTPALHLGGRPGGGLLITPELRHPEGAVIPLFGPERHRLGDYLSVDASSGPPSLIGRDREKELLARNLFEKVAHLSSPDKSIPLDLSRTDEFLDHAVLELESHGFVVDKKDLFDGAILPGPVHVFLDIAPYSIDQVELTGRLETGSGPFPLPVPSTGECSSLLTIQDNLSVYLEGQVRDHVRELCQLFSLDSEGKGLASRYYVSMIHLLRPDLPIQPAHEVSLLPFSPTSLPEESFTRLEEIFQATLRPYQKEAISTLVSLRREGLSGILADEMGLGKTISILGFLAHLKREGLHRSSFLPPLVVLPASLLYNWANEAQRFWPSARIHLHAGTNRRERLKEWTHADILLTTYGTLRNDRHFSSGPPFSCLILDEAHTVKNPDSQTHQVLLNIPAEQKIAVTGTPVENRISDLWGLMNLLMPGLLGSKLQFERRFFRSNSAASEQNRRIDLLRKLVAPLILRRTKEMVLSDLPPKVMIDVWIDPSPEEREMYHRLRNRGREDLLSLTGSLQMAYLTLLLRLRQFACHPALLPPEFASRVSRSSKFDVVRSKVEEGVSEGHKILLFSQFTRILDLFEEALSESGISYVRLDGSTPLDERNRLVQAFQADTPDAPMVFLASLKAGGVGLTLTRADYVFHYDPWWNPQVEAQASDRSHRMGQTKTVFIYRFLVRETVEERVQILQESKRELFDRLINGGSGESGEESFFSRLSLEEMRNLVDR